ANQGESNPDVKFLSRGPGYALFLTAREAVIRFRPSVRENGAGLNSDDPSDAAHPADGSPPRSDPVLRMRFVGAGKSPELTATDPLAARNNYLIGNDAGGWRTDVAQYARVRYRELYPGVDLVFYGNQGHLEHDFVIAPQARPSSIRLAWEGADRL